MTLTVDAQHLGTSEAAWFSSEPLRLLPTLAPVRSRRVVIVAPHPDDEIFGAAGLLLHLAHADVNIVAVSDGEASHPEAVIGERGLRAQRAKESTEALTRLGCRAAVTRLGLPDSAVTDHADDLADALREALRSADLCVAPWRHDGHPDHDACGRAAATASAATGVPLLEYLVWAWHWLEPEDPRLPWQDCAVLHLSRRQAARKRWATHAFASQIRPLVAEPGASPVLPAAVLRRFWRPFEVFVDGRGT